MKGLYIILYYDGKNYTYTCIENEVSSHNNVTITHIAERWKDACYIIMSETKKELITQELNLT